MRTVSNTILAAQKSPSVWPYVRVEYYNGSAYVDVTDDVLGMDCWLYPYSGRATIVLDNHEGAYNDFSYKENNLKISLGFHTQSGIEYSTLPYYWIRDYYVASSMGRNVFVINCEDVWVLIKAWRNTTETNYPQDTTIKDILDAVLTAIGITLGTSISECSYVDTDTPDFTIGVDETGLNIIMRLLNMTDCYLVPRTDTVHLKHCQVGDTSDYTFYTVPEEGQHGCYDFSKEDGLFRPNKCIVEYGSGGNTGTYTYAGATAVYPAEYQIRPDLSTEAKAIARATSYVNRAAFHREQGSILVPLECSLELYDKATISNARTKESVTQTKRIGSFHYHSELNQYYAEIAFGGGVNVAPLSMAEVYGSLIKPEPTPIPEAIPWEEAISWGKAEMLARAVPGRGRYVSPGPPGAPWPEPIGPGWPTLIGWPGQPERPLPFDWRQPTQMQAMRKFPTIKKEPKETWIDTMFPWLRG